jgi:hypothetical protein
MRMMGEVEAEVVDVRRLDVHGVGYVDVAIRYPSGATESARLGAEGVPDDLRPGERVLATRVANMVVSLRRPAAT